MNKKIIKVEMIFNQSEALILSDFLSRFNQLKSFDGFKFEDQAEQRVLWDIECCLEKFLTEPYIANWGEALKQAREEVRDKLD
ncbi:MAG: hypothetical protein A2445_00315 [Candidatus Jacksonbacteria bacterium RIFOXYC2_FULL_44_29]|nr:MAG: hypothetical protein A2240_00020 [Candidatus Jacksonbacteria bacterium RIFOXYA2_FULL_43_12]OGY76414.1 MAG: hypothetical protein A2295_06200 [Candidatus Jacksonbacteria bacterium RIFOXYB2_FULL_44_15]OGY78029.1 MAG: hypothetical protein A2550_01840 [Candidatus Jacksonbacteria bacterium RIFOXYD2_FULL_43_21]OGY79706.1 MAG: hypothetical protein A2445_00315 [Candidatus Jacksonbacteria bacterium RIFOXYC2_FULL_44_29]